MTVIYPFLPGDRIDDGRRGCGHRRVDTGLRRLRVMFERVAWFDKTVVWLAPDPAQPFRDLTHAVRQRFPEAPPYGGAHEGVV